MKTFSEYLKEMTTAGSGAIAGIGINQDGSQYNAATAPNSYGEPGVHKKKKKEIKVEKRMSPEILRFIQRFQTQKK